MDKIIYHFDPATGELIGSGPVYIGPAGDEQIPAFATVTPPPDLVDGHVAVAALANLTAEHACSWTLVRDWRQAALYRTADGTAVQAGAAELNGWSGLGDVPAGVTDAPPPSSSYVWSGEAWVFDLAAAKAVKLAAIDDQVVVEMAKPFRVGTHTFNADPVSAASILAAGQIGGIAKSAEREYSASLPAADGSEVELDADGLIDAALALGAHQDACRRTAKQLKDAVAAAGEESAIGAIKWPED